MTEEGIDPFAQYLYEPEGSLWIMEPAFVSGIAPDEWEQAAKTLHAFAEFVMRAPIGGGYALEVALTDVEDRVRIQARRAREEGWKEPKDGEPTPGQQARIERLINRCDDLDNAVDAAREAAKAERDRTYAEDYILGKLVPFLEGECDAAGDDLRRYMREVGLPKD